MFPNVSTTKTPKVDGRPVPPNDLNPTCLFSVSTVNKVWMFCCETLAELKGWQSSLEEARMSNMSMFMKPAGYANSAGYANANSLMMNQTLARNPLIQTGYHPNQFNQMVLSQMPTGYLPAGQQSLPAHQSAIGALPPQTYASPLMGQHPQLSYPSMPLLNTPLSSSYPQQNMRPHSTSNGLLLQGGLSTGSHQLAGAQLSPAHHSTSLTSPYTAAISHRYQTTSPLHHAQTNPHHLQANPYSTAALSNGVSSMSGNPNYSTRQTILPTSLQPATVPNMTTMYNRSDLGMLPQHQGHPLLWTPNSVWW